MYVHLCTTWKRQCIPFQLLPPCFPHYPPAREKNKIQINIYVVLFGTLLSTVETCLVPVFREICRKEKEAVYTVIDFLIVFILHALSYVL